MGEHTEITSKTATVVSERTLRIRALNDALRTTFMGGEVVMTAGIHALPADERMAIVEAVRAFDTFTEDNDPYGEHDCATLTVGAHEAMFKIDYYDAKVKWRSPDESDPSVTRRVLTILLASEY